MTTAPAVSPAPDLAASESRPLRAYAYRHARTVGSTGYFSCEPEEELALEQELAWYAATPLDDFLHEHLLGRIGALDEADLLAVAGQMPPDASPALASLLRESALVFPQVQAVLGTLPEEAPKALGQSAPSLPWIAPDLRLTAAARADHAAALAWGRLFQDNLARHLPLPRLEECGIPLLHDRGCLAQAMQEISRPDSADILAAAHGRLAVQPWPEGGRPPAQETLARALNALERAQLLAGPEMRHEASLSPIALLRHWHVAVRTLNGRHAHELRGQATAYGRGLSLAGARAACLMEVVERASAYAGLEPGGVHGHGQVADRRAPLPLLKATAQEQTASVRRVLLPPMTGERLAQTPLHWLKARSATGEEALVPLQSVLLFCNADEPRLPALPGSTGLASGNTPEEARLAALMEVIERDADATTPFRRQTCFCLQSRDARIQGLLDDYAARGIRVQFQDISSEFGIPVYRCFVTAQDGGVAAATGASLRGADAALSALTETPWPYSYARPAPYGLASGPGLAGLPTRWLEDLPDFGLPTPQASLALLEAVLTAHGREIFNVDLTRADLDIPVVRVLVPGLEPHSDFDSLNRPSPRLFARHALFSDDPDSWQGLFRA